LGIGDWGLGIGNRILGSWDLAQPPIPNPQSPIPNPQSPIPNKSSKNKLKIKIIINQKLINKIIKIIL